MRTWLFTSIADDILDVFDKPEQSAYELWVRITNHFTANQASRVIYLRNEFHNIIQGTLSIIDYLRTKRPPLTLYVTSASLSRTRISSSTPSTA
jgi:hypothetical protein